MLLCVVSFSLFSNLLLLFPESAVINRRFPSSCTRGFASVAVLLLLLLVVVLAKTRTQPRFQHFYAGFKRDVYVSLVWSVSVCSLAHSAFQIFHTSWLARATLSRCSLTACPPAASGEAVCCGWGGGDSTEGRLDLD